MAQPFRFYQVWRQSLTLNIHFRSCTPTPMYTDCLLPLTVEATALIPSKAEASIHTQNFTAFHPLRGFGLMSVFPLADMSWFPCLPGDIPHDIISPINTLACRMHYHVEHMSM